MAQVGPGARIGEYVLERALGRGSMGAVFVGRHLTSGARHAVKVLLLGGARDPTRRERFAREARALARLDRHPGVVRIHAHGVEPDGVAWCALELVEGGDLATRLEAGLPPLDEALAIAEGVARALAHVHAAGLVHRDLKAGNVLLPAPGTPVLTDFGVARDEAEERLTRTAEVLGTPHAMAPEQVTGDRSVGPAVDVWALGVLLHELVAGEPPFTGAGLAELAVAIAAHDPPPLGSSTDRVPADLEAVARLCLRKEAAERPTAAQVADALAEVRRGARCALASGERAARRRAPRAPTIAAAAAAAGVVVLLAGAGLHALRVRRARDRDLAQRLEVALGAADAAAEAADRTSRAWRLGAAPTPPDPASLASAAAALAEAGGASFALEATRTRVVAEQALVAGAPLEDVLRPVDDPLAAALLRVVAAARAGDAAALAQALAAPALERRGPARVEAQLAAAYRLADAGDAARARALLAEARARSQADDEVLQAGGRRVEAAALVADAVEAALALDVASAERALQAARVSDPAVSRAGVARAARAALGAPGTSTLRTDRPTPRARTLARLLEAIAALGPLPREAARPFFELAHAQGGDADQVVLDLGRAMELDPWLRAADDLSGMVTFRVASFLAAAGGSEEEQAVQLLLGATRAGLPIDLTLTQRRRLERSGRLDAAVSRAPEEWAARVCRARVTADPRETDDALRQDKVRGALADLRVALLTPGLPAYPRVDARTHALACEVWLAPERADALCDAALREPGADRRRVTLTGVTAQQYRKDPRLVERWARRLIGETALVLAQQAGGALLPGIASIPDPQDKRDQSYLLLCDSLRDQRDPARWLAAADEGLRNGMTSTAGHLQRALALEAGGDLEAARAALAAHDTSRGSGLEPLAARDLRARLAGKAQDGAAAGR